MAAVPSEQPEQALGPVVQIVILLISVLLVRLLTAKST